MATARLYPTYCRSGYSAYSGSGSSTYLLVGYFSASAYPAYYAYANGKTYRGVLGYDFSVLYGKTINSATLYLSGSDNINVSNAATSAFTATLSADKAWGSSGIASASTDTGRATGASRQWSRAITNADFLSGLATVNGVGYIHVASSGYMKIWEGVSSSQSAMAYIEVDYTDTPAPTPEDSITIDGFSAKRWEYDAERGEYVESSTGTICGLSFSVSVDTSEEGHEDNHIVSAGIAYGESGGETHAVDITPSSASTTLNAQDDIEILGDVEFSATTSYDITIVITDAFSEKSVTVTLSSGNPMMHFSATRKGVSVGMFSSSKPEDETGKFECAYPAYFYGGVFGVGAITTGRVESTVVSPNSYTDVDALFGKTFDSPPMVFISPESSSDGTNMGSVSGVILTGSTTTTGFTIRIYNNTGNNRGIAFRWMAV